MIIIMLIVMIPIGVITIMMMMMAVIMNFISHDFIENCDDKSVSKKYFMRKKIDDDEVFDTKDN